MRTVRTRFSRMLDALHFAAYHIGYFYPGGAVLSHDKINAQMANFYGAIVAFVADAVVTVAGQPRHRTEAREGTRRAGVGHSRPEGTGPGVGAEAEVVGLAQDPRRRLTRDHRRFVRDLHLGGDDMSDACGANDRLSSVAKRGGRHERRLRSE